MYSKQLIHVSLEIATRSLSLYNKKGSQRQNHDGFRVKPCPEPFILSLPKCAEGTEWYCGILLFRVFPQGSPAFQIHRYYCKIEAICLIY